jgi:putative oligomerization/nucleic acid binding protein
MSTRKKRTTMPPSRLGPRVVGPRLALCCAVLLGSASAQAGWLDGLLAQGQSPATSAAAKQRSWPLHEFTRIELVAREPGSEPNQHPATLHAQALREQLAQTQSVGRNGPQPLFTAEELGELMLPLTQALGRAGPGDDVLLLSSTRRAGDIFMSPTAVTARLFVQGGQLQFIVHDARFEFFDTYRGTHVAPRFIFGSRSSAGGAIVHSAAAANRRPDWLAIPLQGEAPASAPAAPAAIAPAVGAPPPPARKPLDAAAVDDIERRLEVLKRLREKGLITEDEYQQKRREILQLL